MTTRGDRSASKPDRIDTRQRAAEAVQLRAEGLTYQEIADQLGFTTENAANKAVLNLLRRTETEAADTLKALEVRRLDLLWSKTIRGITRSETSQQGLSAALVSAAVRVSERRSRLLGLDSPTQIEDVSQTADLQAAVQEIMAAATHRARTLAPAEDTTP